MENKNEICYYIRSSLSEIQFEPFKWKDSLWLVVNEMISQVFRWIFTIQLNRKQLNLVIWTWNFRYFGAHLHVQQILCSFHLCSP